MFASQVFCAALPALSARVASDKLIQDRTYAPKLADLLPKGLTAQHPLWGLLQACTATDGGIPHRAPPGDHSIRERRNLYDVALLKRVKACFEAFYPQELAQLVVLGALLRNTALQLLPDLAQGLAMFLCALPRPRWRKSWRQSYRQPDLSQKA